MNIKRLHKSARRSLAFDIIPLLQDAVRSISAPLIYLQENVTSHLSTVNPKSPSLTMSSATNPLSSTDLTILALGESAKDKAAVLDDLKIAGLANMQDTATDDFRELRYAGEDGLAWRVLDPGDSNLIPSNPSGVTAIMFLVDVANYDQPTSPCSPTSPRLHTSLAYFASVANAPQYVRTPVLLFFHGANAMAAKLPSSPLERLFPDYDSANDPATVNSGATMGVCFLASKFAQESPREDDQVYVHPVTGPKVGARELEFVMTALEDIVGRGNKAS